MSSGSVTTQVFNAVHRHGVDAKRRIQIPSIWRPSEPSTQFTMIVWPQHREGTCLRVLPPKELAQLMESLDAIPNDPENKTVLKRIIGSESVQVTLDKAGRICVPEEMVRAAGIEKEAVLVGLLDRFEIWNPAVYDRVKAADRVMAQQALRMME